MIRYAVARREALVAEMENFRDAVLGKPADIVTMLEGLETVEVATAVLAASRDCATVALGASQPAHARPPHRGPAGVHRAAR